MPAFITNSMPKEVEDAARSLNAKIKNLESPEQRIEFIELVTRGICVACGALEGGVCHCQNDE